MTNTQIANICIDVIGVILMIILYFSSSRRSTQKSLDQRLYNLLILSVLIMFIIDGVSWFLDGKVFIGDKYILNYVNLLLYLLGPINPILWACYVDYKVYENENRLKKRFLIYSIPFFINSIFCIIQIFTPVLYTFDVLNNNRYSTLPLSWVTYSIPFIYIIYTTIFTASNKDKIKQRNFMPLLLYVVLPAFGVLLQSIGKEFGFHISGMYIGTGLSLLIVYIRVQNDLGVTDFLTGLNNRRHLEDYLKSTCIHLHDNEVLYGIMIDIDDFKQINDKYGHASGDHALEKLSNIFLKSVRYNDFVSRYAGDEFVIIVRLSVSDDINRVIKSLLDNTFEYNKNSGLPYSLEFSYGYAAYKSPESYDMFLKRIDEEMYKNKNSKKMFKAAKN